ncbi:MAG: FG-GAP repeat protein [Chitinophagaceae bacterium]|nr:FG-GAP repeat protein [Chitinophagaceae bacterium]
MGYSVSSAGDVNNDGYSDVIIGASLFDNGSGDEGAAFIFYGSPTGITTVAADTIEGNQQAASLGNVVSAAGDVNGDGYSDVIAGAYIYDKGQVNEGIAVVYYGSATGINSLQGDTLESNQANANFGNSVSSAGDVNGDGYGDIIVGANLYDNGETNEGLVYLYLGSANGIDTSSVKVLEINQANATFGNAVSSAGDVNGDGYSDVIAGAKLYDAAGVDQGRAYIYYGSDTGIAYAANVILEDGLAIDNFGSSVSSAGDINGDGFSDVLVGAPGVDLAQSNAGAIYIYHGSALGINTSATIRIDGPATQFANAFFGGAVAGAGDVNGDGYSDIIVGASQFSVGFFWEGRSFVYLGTPAGINTTAAAALITEGQQTFNGFSVAGAGDINGDGFSDIISGAYRSSHSSNFLDEGLAYVYYGNSRELGFRNNLRLYNSNQTTPIQQSNNSDQLFAAGIFAKSPLGRQKGKMVLETVRNGVAFPGNPISNSTTATATDATFTNLGLTGVELKRQAIKMIPTKATNIRARVKYDPATAITGQVYGPWRYYQPYLMGNTNKILSVVTYNWTGNVSTVWENPANWSSNVVPISTSAVIIPAGRPRYPTVNATTSIKSLSLAPGTSTTTATGVTLNIIGH